MKRSARLAILAALSFAAHLRAGSGLWQVRVEMPIVSLPTSAALPLVTALRDSHQVGAAVDNLLARVTRGEATLIAWPVVWATNGALGVSETIDEWRYPSEFDPPQAPQNFGAIPRQPPSPATWVPDSFETRNLGITLEILPTVSRDGAWIDLKVDPQHVSFFEFQRFKLSKPELGAYGFIDQPEFFTAKVPSHMFVRSGEWNLVGTFVVPKPEPHIEFFILRATAHSLAP